MVMVRKLVVAAFCMPVFCVVVFCMVVGASAQVAAQAPVRCKGVEPDCNGNGLADVCDIESRFSLDCNANQIPDECDVQLGGVLDCNENLVPDACEIRAATPLVHESFAAATIDTATWQAAQYVSIDTDTAMGIGYALRFDSENAVLRTHPVDLQGARWANLSFVSSSPHPVRVLVNGDGFWRHVPASPRYDGLRYHYDIAIPAAYHSPGTRVWLTPSGADEFVPFLIDEITLSRYEPDCNGNGVVDRCDVEFFGECNDNGIPDECDLQTTRWERFWHPGAWRSFRYIRTADFDLDGDADFVTTGGFSPEWQSVWWNDGEGRFDEAVIDENVGKGVFGALRPTVALVTDDEYPDLLIVGYQGVYLAANTDGSFSGWELYFGFDFSWAVVGGDINADGDEDVIVSTTGSSDQLVVIFGALLQSSPIDVDEPVIGLQVADFNGDGFQDVLVEQTSRMTIQLNQGIAANGLWLGFAQSAIDVVIDEGMQHATPVIADFNDDGLSDIAYTNFRDIALPIDNASLSVHLSLGTGSTGEWLGFEETVIPDLDWRARSLALFPGAEGRPDLIVGSYSFEFGTINRYANLGTDETNNWRGLERVDRIWNHRQFPHHQQWGPGIHELVAADVNGDGLTDIALIADNDTEDGMGLSTIVRVLPFSLDCNGNDLHDECETDRDINGNGIPDTCEPDCNRNKLPDDYDIAIDTSTDCNGNEVPDECDLAEGVSEDCDLNELPDECEYAYGEVNDCNANDRPDVCDFAAGTVDDCNMNQEDDTCEALGALRFAEWVDGLDNPEIVLPVGAPYPPGYLVSDFYGDDAGVYHVGPEGGEASPFSSALRFAVSLLYVPASFDPLGGRVYVTRQRDTPAVFAVNPDGSLDVRIDFAPQFRNLFGLLYIEEGRGTPFDNHLIVTGNSGGFSGSVVAVSATGERTMIAALDRVPWTPTLAPNDFGAFGGHLFVGTQEHRQIYAVNLETLEVSLFREIDFYLGFIDGVRMIEFSPVGWAKWLNRRYVDQRVLVASYIAPNAFGQPLGGLMIFDQDGLLVGWINKTQDGTRFNPRGILFEEGRLLVADVVSGGIVEVSLDHLDCDADLLPDACAIAMAPELDLDENDLMDVCEHLGDADADGVIGLEDWAVLQSCFGATEVDVPASCSPVDMNRDRQVDMADHIIFRRSLVE